MIFWKKKKTKKVYICSECGFKYEEEEWRDKCQAWCKEKKTCNLEIIEHAIKD